MSTSIHAAASLAAAPLGSPPDRRRCPTFRRGLRVIYPGRSGGLSA